MNTVILSGNVANIYVNQSNVRLVIADRYKDKTAFLPVTCFGSTANFVQQYFRVGDHVAVQGRLGMYKDSCNRETIDIVADRVSFEGYPKPNKPQNPGMANSFTPVHDNANIPLEIFGDGAPDTPVIAGMDDVLDDILSSKTEQLKL